MSLNGANGIHMSIGANRTILCVIGTRPEAIKMAPVILSLRKKSFQVRVLATAQHRSLLDQVLDLFGIEPDIDLNIMKPNQSLASLTARLLLNVEEVLVSEKPDAVLVQGYHHRNDCCLSLLLPAYLGWPHRSRIENLGYR